MTQYRILVVDDEPDVRTVIELTLSRDPDFTIRTCGSGKLALSEAASWSPDLVVLDVMMPGMDGLEVLTNIRESSSLVDLPVIMTTARDQSGDIVAALQLGAIETGDPFVLGESLKAIQPENAVRHPATFMLPRSKRDLFQFALGELAPTPIDVVALPEGARPKAALTNVLSVAQTVPKYLAATPVWPAASAVSASASFGASSPGRKSKTASNASRASATRPASSSTSA